MEAKDLVWQWLESDFELPVGVVVEKRTIGLPLKVRRADHSRQVNIWTWDSQCSLHGHRKTMQVNLADPRAFQRMADFLERHLGGSD